MQWTQLTGNIRAGLTPDTAQDVSEEVTRYLVNEKLETQERRKSFANVEPTRVKAGVVGELGIDFDTAVDNVSTSLRELARTAMYDDSTGAEVGRNAGELWVAGTEKPGEVSATNQLVAGWALVEDLDIFGGTPGEIRSQSKTWRLRAIQRYSEDPYPLDEES